MNDNDDTPRPFVLVVEDDPRTAELRGRMLTERGCKVVVTESIESAMNVLQSPTQVDLAVIDINLGIGAHDRSGVDLAHRIQNEWPETVVVGYSAIYADADLSEDEKANFQEIFLKGSMSIADLRGNADLLVDLARRSRGNAD